MNLRKNLPEIFDEFAESRRQAFIDVKKRKDEGKPVIGIFCTYFPQELAVAMGAAVVSLCATSDETIPAAEEELPKNLCPLVKSSYGFGKTDKCPFFYFSDLVVAETTCDGKKKMYEHMEKFKPVHVMELPNRVSQDGLKLWKNEIIRMKEKLEIFFGVTITEDDIRRGIKVKNAERTAMRTFYSLMKQETLPISGMDVQKTLVGTTFHFDREQIPGQIEELISRIKAEGNRLEQQPRILITGCPIGGATEKVIKIIEENGAWCVAFENCTGAKAIEENVDESMEDVYEALAKKYMKIGCSCMAPNENRFRLLDEMITDYRADAVIDVELSACHTYAIEAYKIKEFINGEKGIPYLSIETDYSSADIGQLTTRISAFIEMLK